MSREAFNRAVDAYGPAPEKVDENGKVTRKRFVLRDEILSIKDDTKRLARIKALGDAVCLGRECGLTDTQIAHKLGHVPAGLFGYTSTQSRAEMKDGEPVRDDKGELKLVKAKVTVKGAWQETLAPVLRQAGIEIPEPVKPKRGRTKDVVSVEEFNAAVNTEALAGLFNMVAEESADTKDTDDGSEEE